MKKIFFTSILALGIASGISAQTKSVNDNAQMEQTNGTNDDINETGVVGISGWDSFNKLSAEMYTLKGANYFTTIKMMRSMQPTVATLKSTMPDWMKTEEIIEDVDDFVKDYNELVTSTDADDEEFRENLEEIGEQYEDLREEANETFIAYRKTVMDGNEEYKEEIEKDRASRKNMKDGHEEYKEETKELKKIRDGKKNNR